MVKLFSTVLTIAFLVACRNDGRQTSEVSSVAASADQSTCGANSQSLSLINGETTTQFRSVVLLGAIKKVGENFKRTTCTGTFVGHNVILTAAHCVDGTTKGGLFYIPGDNFSTINDFMSSYGKGIEPKAVLFAGKFGDALDPNKAEERRKDMALLIMPDNSAPAVTPIIDHPPAESQPVTLVGFGATSIDHPDASVALTKRYGYNRLRLSYPGITGGGLFINGRSQNSGDNQASSDTMSAPGDSGGPMFVDGAVAGITTGGFIEANNTSKAAAVYLDLNNNESKMLIQKGIQQGAGIEQAAKGPLQTAPFSSSTGCGTTLAQAKN